MRNGWTGGQYSVYRAVFGAYLFVHFLKLVSSRAAPTDGSWNVLLLVDSSGFTAATLAFGLIAAVAFGIGWHDRPAAVVLWYIWACSLGSNPLVGQEGLPWVGWLLIAHLFVPAAPFGSWAARRRVDPAGGWVMPPAIFALAWIAMSLELGYRGAMQLTEASWTDGTALSSLPLLLFAPLALFRVIRPWLWLAMVTAHLVYVVLVGSDAGPGLWLLHLFTSDPGWVKPATASGPDRVFYDGSCGLCHGSVRLLLAEDRTGQAFRFAPLQGEAFTAAVPVEQRTEIPDSMVLITPDGVLLTRSRAVTRCLERLGGGWRVLGRVLSVVPRGVADGGYDLIAAVRLRLFRRPDDACPLIPADLRDRFDL